MTSIYANLLKQKEEFNSQRTCLEHQYDRRDVMWKRSIAFFAVLVAVAEDAAIVTPPYSTVPRGKTPYTEKLRERGNFFRRQVLWLYYVNLLNIPRKKNSCILIK